jgi:hypothetical protein
MGAAGRAKVRDRLRASAVVAQYEALWDALARDAGALAWPPPDAAPPAPMTPVPAAAALSPTRIFRAYPTRFLGPDDRLVATAGGAIDPPYSDVAPLLDRAVLDRMREKAVAPVAAADLVALAPAPARGWFMLLWLVKYGVLRLATAPPAPR